MEEVVMVVVVVPIVVVAAAGSTGHSKIGGRVKIELSSHCTASDLVNQAFIMKSLNTKESEC